MTVTTTNTSSTGAMKGDFRPAGKWNSTPYFNCDPQTFHNCLRGKRKGKHWKSFIKGQLGADIQGWVSSNRKSNFLLRNTQDGSFIYAHRNF